MAKSFSVPPAGIAAKAQPFTFTVPEESVKELHQLVALSKIGPSTWYNEHKDGSFGISRDWLRDAKEAWLNNFDWRRHESRINEVPNFKVAVNDEEGADGKGVVFDLHFAALFSTREDAIPIIFMHGWPGSFLEFLPMMGLLRAKYTPETLPYHIIVPSLPDYGLSIGPEGRKSETTMEQAARLLHKLMLELGFGKSGYVAQGGDVGAGLAHALATQYDACKAYHLNVHMAGPGDKTPGMEKVTPEELEHMQRSKKWVSTGRGYAMEHGTRPATVGLALSANPLAMLAWIGEKFIEWADKREPIPLDTILAMVSFYWLTETYPHSLYPYRRFVKLWDKSDELAKPSFPPSAPEHKPFGYSAFPHEIATLPKAWAEELFPNLASYKSHPVGGHFAALEQPKALLGDVEEFVQQIAKNWV